MFNPDKLPRILSILDRLTQREDARYARYMAENPHEQPLAGLCLAQQWLQPREQELKETLIDAAFKLDAQALFANRGITTSEDHDEHQALAERISVAVSTRIDALWHRTLPQLRVLKQALDGEHHP